MVCLAGVSAFVFFFFNDTATTEIYTYCHTLSLHDALPISPAPPIPAPRQIVRQSASLIAPGRIVTLIAPRSEEHTSELQSLMRISYAVFCLKKKTRT